METSDPTDGGRGQVRVDRTVLGYPSDRPPPPRISKVLHSRGWTPHLSLVLHPLPSGPSPPMSSVKSRVESGISPGVYPCVLGRSGDLPGPFIVGETRSRLPCHSQWQPEGPGLCSKYTHLSTLDYFTKRFIFCDMFGYLVIIEASTRDGQGPSDGNRFYSFLFLLLSPVSPGCTRGDPVL